MSTPIIRLARPGDEPHIHAAHMRSIREICVEDHGKEELKGWGYRPLGDRWVEAIKSGSVLVVEHEGAICGCGYVKVQKSEAKAHLYSLYLIPEMLNKGLGKKLLHLLVEKAQSRGASIISLDSSLTAHGFYRKFGFVDTGPKRKREIGGHPVTSIPMELTCQ